MKKSLLLIAALMIVAAGAMAQDIYLGVTQTSGGDKVLNLVKNNDVMYTHSYSGASYEMTDIIATDNGDVYYLNHRLMSNNNETTQWTDVRKQSGGSNTVVYNCPTGQGINLQALAYDKVTGDVYACGSYFSSEYNRDESMITKNGEIFYQKPADEYEGKMMGIAVINGDVFTCGGEAANEGGGGEDYSYARVWKNGEQIASAYSTGVYSYAYDMVVYNDYMYVCGKIKEDGVWKAVVWRGNPSSSNQTLQRVATISNTESYCTSMDIDAGSIYVSYMISGVTSGVWKFNTNTNTTDEEFITYHAPSAPAGNIVANNHGVFIAANGGSCYYLDGNEVSTTVSGTVTKIAVATPRTAHVYNLPFYDYFDNDEYTHFDEWFNHDYDNNNGYYASYWERYEYADEEFAVSHRYNGSSEQRGEFDSPAIRIPAGYNASLGFNLRIQYLSDLATSTIWVLENENGDLLTEDNFSSFPQHKVWDINDHTDELEANEWIWFDVDLSAYAGKIINLVFYYRGEDAHRWTIDDIEVTGEEITEVKEIAEDVELNVMPNPASDFISITGVDGIEDITIYNTLGQIVKTAQVSDGETISIEGLSQGVYMLQSEKSAQTIKFIVE